MNKQEILDAINATITPNGVKGITAESLANILTEIVNAMGEGGGAGGEYIDMTLLEPDNPESFELTAEAKEHNAELYAKVVDAMINAKAVPSVSVHMDGGEAYYASSVKLMEEKIAFAFHIASHNVDAHANYLTELPNMSTMQVEHVVIGGDVMQVVVNILADGSIEFLIPGLM